MSNNMFLCARMLYLRECLCSVSPSRSRAPDFKDTELIYSCLSSGLLELLMAQHRFALSSGVRSARCMCWPQEKRAHVTLL